VEQAAVDAEIPDRVWEVMISRTAAGFVVELVNRENI
jgi:hypothetical protein